MLVLAAALLFFSIWMGVRKQFLGAIVGFLGAGLVVGPVGAFAFTHDTVFKLTSGFFLTLHVTPATIGLAVSLAAVLAVVACLGPGWAVARLSVVKGLKTLD